jgi:hypothetical protein
MRSPCEADDEQESERAMMGAGSHAESPFISRDPRSVASRPLIDASRRRIVPINAWERLSSRS